MPKSSSNRLAANLYLSITAIIWGSTFFIIRDTLHAINAVTLIGYRSLFAAIVLGVGLLIFKKRNLFANFKEGLLLGVVLFAVYITQTIALYYTTAVDAGFITGLFLIFIPIFNFIFWRKILTPADFIAILFALVGLWFATGGIYGFNRGDFLVLLSAIVWALYILMVDKVVKKELEPFILIFQQLLVMAVLSFVVMLLFRLPLEVRAVHALYAILYLAIFSNIIAYVLQFIGQKHATPISASIVLFLEPISAAVFAWTLGGEHFHWIKLFGGTLILLAITFSQMPLLKFIGKKKVHTLAELE